MKKKRIKLSVVCFCFCLTIQAQKYDDAFRQLKTTYPDAQIINLIDYKTVEIKVNNDELSIIQSYEKENLYMDDRANGASEDYLKYNNFLDIENIKATSYPFVNGKYKKIKVKDFKHKDVLTGSFHDDVKQIDFVYPQMGTASKTNLSYDEVLKNPRFLNPIYFGKFNPILHKKVEFVVDNDVEISFKSFNTEAFQVELKTNKKRRKTIYTWEIKNVPAFKYENSSANAKEILPHIIPVINSYTINGEKTEVLGEVNHLYNWYYSMVKDINQAPVLPALTEKAIQLTQDKESDLAKVEAIYQWVQQEIKYIDFEYDLGGFIPREANDVYNKRYGDCKDNSSILSVMLNAIGLDGYLTWVGTRKLPYTYHELPTPHVDNHMILSYIDQNDHIYYLDATGRYHNLELPTSFIQGKEVLIGLGENEFRIEKVPFVEAKTNYHKETTQLQIEGENLVGNANIKLNAYPKIDLFRQREDIKKDDLRSYYRNRFKKESSKFVITEFKETNLFSYNDAFQLDYQFKITDYIRKIDDELYINLNLNDQISNYKTNREFIYDVEIEHKKSYQFKNILSIPDQYQISYVPENMEESNPYFDAKINYEVKGNKLIYNYHLNINFIRLTPEEQKVVSSAIEKVQKQFRELLILKEKNDEPKN